jgi:hypothetical protein
MSIIIEISEKAQAGKSSGECGTNLLAFKTLGTISGVTMPGPIV